MSVSGIRGPSQQLTVKPQAEVKSKPATTARSPERAPGFDTQSTFVADAGVKGGGKAETKTPLQRAEQVSSEINKWGGFAGSALAALDSRLHLGAKLQATQRGVEKAVHDRAHLATGRAMVVKGYDRSIGQIRNLLNNPVVKKDAQVVGRLQRELQRVQGLKAQQVAPFDRALGRLNTFLAANQPKLAQLSKAGKALGAVGDALTAAGGVTNGFSVAVNSPAQTRAGRIVDGVLAGAVNYAMGKVPGLSAVGAVDAVSGQNVSNAINGLVGTAVTLAEAAITRDTAGLEALAEKSRNGDYGIFLQAGNAAGNALASLGDPAARQRFVEEAAAGRYGIVGQFGNALGDGLGRLFFGGN